jgi:hypothetical protein
MEIDNYEQSDLANTLSTEGLSGQIGQVTHYPLLGGAGVSGCAFTAGCGSTEALLDIAAVLGIAPGVNVTVFIAPPGNLLAMLHDAIDVVTNGGGFGGILSVSQSICEPNISSSDAINLDSLIEQYTASGLTVFAASGDFAGNCTDGGGSYPNATSFPADLPHLIALGGTHLLVNAPGYAYVSETWWNDSKGKGGGFGVSSIFASEPANQSKLNRGAGGRSVPDVSADAYDGSWCARPVRAVGESPRLRNRRRHQPGDPALGRCVNARQPGPGRRMPGLRFRQRSVQRVSVCLLRLGNFPLGGQHGKRFPVSGSDLRILPVWTRSCGPTTVSIAPAAEAGKAAPQSRWRARTSSG